ncbi:MAG TPA: DUF72 domain-containing protein [Kineosporiaceae bacterium]
MVGQVRVGISGWRYPPWRGTFYPAELPRRRELEYAARQVSTIEINGSFYSLQRPEYYRAWAEQVPDGFVFAVKGGRFITHLKRLVGGDQALANFYASGLLALGPKLGPILWQLPPSLRFDPGVLGAFLDALPRTTREAARIAERHDERLAGRALTAADEDRPMRYALEVRHTSFAVPDLVTLLSGRDVALVVADTAGRWPHLDDVTAGFVYVRLHGDTELYASGYGEKALDRWAERVRGWSGSGLDVWVYFDNDAKARAPFDAMALADRLGLGPGRSATRPGG